jgi:hypothetical protein
VSDQTREQQIAHLAGVLTDLGEQQQRYRESLESIVAALRLHLPTLNAARAAWDERLSDAIAAAQACGGAFPKEIRARPEHRQADGALLDELRDRGIDPTPLLLAPTENDYAYHYMVQPLDPGYEPDDAPAQLLLQILRQRGQTLVNLGTGADALKV